MTSIFVYEYLSAQRADVSDPSARLLRHQGQAMLDAVAADFRQVAGLRVDTFTLDDHPGAGEAILFRRRAAVAEFSLLIAPEFDDILETRCLWVREAGGRLLGPSLEAVRLTADKYQLAQYLRTLGVPTPKVWTVQNPQPAGFPQVWKPRFGAGSLATYQIAHPEQFYSLRTQLEEEGWVGEMIGQEWVAGIPIGVSFLAGPHTLVPLLPSYQVIANQGRIKYQGGRMPVPEPWARRAIAVARQALQGIPGLLGFVGVDVLLDETGRGRDLVLEINPRLTTSYVGLRALSLENLAEVMLLLAKQQPHPPLRWREQAVTFTTDGAIEVV